MSDKKKSPPEKENERLAKFEEQIAALEEENGKLHESYLRLAAEFDNYKKRQSKNFGEMVSAARDALLLKMLDVFDNFERAIESSDEPPSAEALIEGIRLIHKQFEDMLKSERIDAVCAIGDDFDPTLHEAVALVPADDCENKVVGVVQQGYRCGDRLIRPARVVVSGGKAQEAEGAGS